MHNNFVRKLHRVSAVHTSGDFLNFAINELNPNAVHLIQATMSTHMTVIVRRATSHGASDRGKNFHVGIRAYVSLVFSPA
jgi:hypothetical protein